MFDRVKILTGIMAVGLIGAPTVFGFSMLGPRQGYQTGPFGYDRVTVNYAYVNGDGDNQTPGPVNLGEEYRFTVPEIFVAFDSSFLDYFGSRGQQEVQKAIDYFNALPPFSSMSADLTEYPLETQRENYRAGALELVDLKSFTMFELCQWMGLAAPELNVWGVQSRAVIDNLPCPNYAFFIIKRNFDPTTWEPTSYVNGALYTFGWVLSCAPAPDFSYVSPIAVDPLRPNFSSVAGGNVDTGVFFNGLTRDDVGGLRYIYRKNNYNMEQLPPNVFAGAGGGGSPWSIVVPPPTNAVVSSAALRTGIDHLTITVKPYDSLLSSFFVGFTNSFSVNIATNGAVVSQSWSRPVLQPDYAFRAGNLPISVGGPDGTGTYTVWQFPAYVFDSLNQNGNINGPGSMNVGSGGTLTFEYQKIGDVFTAAYPNFLDEASLVGPFWRWGSFDGTTNAPVVYPSGASIQEMENLALGQ